MMFAAEAAGHSEQLEKGQKTSGKEHVALVEVSRCCSEEELRARLAKYGVAWCNSVDSGQYLVRFLSHEGLLSAVKTLHGSNWLGGTFEISPHAVGQGQLLSGGVQHDSSFTPRADSIPAMQAPEQLDYFSAVLQEEQQLQLQHQLQQEQQQQEDEGREFQHIPAQAPPSSSSAFHSQSMQDLEPCDAEWNPPALADSSLLAPLEEQGSFNADASPLQSFSSGTSTCQLWSQRSIGAVARKDLAKFAAMQHMALQHSCNSPTQASLLAAGHHVMGLGSPWGSAHSSGSLASLALTAAGNTGGTSSLFQESVRRTSSPSGHLAGHHSLGTPAAGTPRSPHHQMFNSAGVGGAEGSYASALQQQEQGQLGRSGSTGSGSRGSAWPNQGPNLTVNLPSELGLGDSSALADEEVRRLNSMATARQQQQQAGSLGPPSIRTGHHHSASVGSSLPNFAGMLSSYGSDSASSPLAGPPGTHLTSENSGSLLAAAGGASSRFATPRSFNGNMAPGDPPGFPCSPHHLAHIPPPPPPPLSQQGGAGSAAGPPGTPGTPPGGLLGQPPPPPPPGGSRTPPAQGPLLESYSSNGYDGTPRAAGVISPVQPAPPPPRSVTPGGTGGWQGAAGSGGCSPPCGGMSQPQSPSSGYRGSRPAGMRGFQHGMSNLGISCQHSSGYDGYGPGPQQASPYHRGASPMGHRAHSPTCGIPPPPPPPPSMHVPPGYVAAANAAVSACGAQISPVPSPPPPAGGFGFRSGSACGPLAAAASGPVGSALTVSAVGAPTGRAAGVSGLLPHASAPVSSAQTSSNNDSSSNKDGGTAPHDVCASAKTSSDTGMGGAAAVKGNGANSRTDIDVQRLQQQQQQQLKADGVLFVEELLQLLKLPGATAGNMFLANLTDLLECALGAASTATTTTPNKGSPTSLVTSSVGPSSRRTSNDEQRAAAAAAAAAVIAANGSSRVPLLATATLAESVAKAALSSSSSSTPRTFRNSRDIKVGDRTARQVPVDAAAFLGMLQEAAAPLLAAAATAAAASSHRGLYGNLSSGGRRAGQQRSSEGPENSTCGSRNQSMGGDGRGSRGGLRGSMVGVGNTQGGSCEGFLEGSLGYSGGSNDLSSLPLNLLLRHSIAGASKGGAGAPLLLPLHPRTTTHSSCGGSAPGTPHGTPMLLVPQTVPELLSTRAALIRLLLSAHAFIHGPVFARMASRLAGIEELYDSMHEDPVVVKRRKCRDMAAMRDVIKRDASFAQAVSSVSSMRNHIYSLSRKVLIGFGLMESLPIDLLLGGLTSELAAILAEACDTAQLGQQQQQQQNGSANHSSTGGATPRAFAGSASSTLGTPRASNSSTSGSRSSGGGSNADGTGLAAAAAADTGSIVLPQHIVEFFMAALPVPKLALLVFVEFVPVDPAPCSTALPPSGLGAPEGWGSGSSSGGGRMTQQQTSKDRRRSSASTDQAVANDSSSGGQQQPGSAAATPRSRGRWGNNRDRDNGRLRESGGGGGGGGGGTGSMPNTPHRGSRGNGFSNGGNAAGSGCDSKRSSNRRSGHGGYDLVAEAAALEAAATAAAPLVAAAVCDLPTGNRRQGSNAGSSS